MQQLLYIDGIFIFKVHPNYWILIFEVIFIFKVLLFFGVVFIFEVIIIFEVFAKSAPAPTPT